MGGTVTEVSTEKQMAASKFCEAEFRPQAIVKATQGTSNIQWRKRVAWLFPHWKLGIR
jgi:hypothetical protein